MPDEDKGAVETFASARDAFIVLASTELEGTIVALKLLDPRISPAAHTTKLSRQASGRHVP